MTRVDPVRLHNSKNTIFNMASKFFLRGNCGKYTRHDAILSVQDAFIQIREWGINTVAFIVKKKRVNINHAGNLILKRLLSLFMTSTT